MTTTLAKAGPVSALFLLMALGCGGRTPAPPLQPAPLPTAAPAPAPLATPTPEPTPEPCTEGLCEEPVSNRNKAVRLTLRLYTVTDGQGNRVNLTLDDDIPIGYILVIDATAKDAEGKETLGKNLIQWNFANASLARIGGQHSHQRRVIPQAPGNMFVTASLDGTTSNELWLRFR